MSDPNKETILPPGSEGGFNLQDAPGAEYSLDELFPSDEGLKVEDGGLAPAAGTSAPTTGTQEPFLKAGSTIYLTREEALRGTEEKDRLIEEYRQKTGIDPSKLRAIGSVTTQQTASPGHKPEEVIRYTQDGRRFYEDLSKAVARNDANAYAETMQRFVYELLEPAAPLVLDSARERAIAAVERDIRDIRSFLESTEYRTFVDGFPSLKQAIETGESNLQAVRQLPEFYRLAYDAARGRKLPELVRQQPQAQPASARPTAQPTTLTPPSVADTSSTSTVSRTPSNAKERREYLEEMERRGIKNVIWK